MLGMGLGGWGGSELALSMGAEQGGGMGAQESILKASVATMVPKRSRATGYGIFECCFGAAWFLGSWLLGVLYDQSLVVMVVVSVAAQLLAAIMFWWKVPKEE